MNKLYLALCSVAVLFGREASATTTARKFNEPDSVYLFSYATTKSNNHNGLHFAWSTDNKKWTEVGNEFSFVRSDYGRWGSEKRMISPYLIPAENGTWKCVWSLNEKDKTFAAVSSTDLIDWGRQAYPEVNAGSNVLRPVISFDKQQKDYVITYVDAGGKYFQLRTKDFKTFGAVKEVGAEQYKNQNVSIDLAGGKASGQVYKVAWPVVDKLLKKVELSKYKNLLHGETTKQDEERFKGMQALNATITVDAAKPKAISDMLLGIFFEDINYAADGGLYAELVQNRDFEYALSDREGHDKNWNSMHSWSVKGENLGITIATDKPVHVNNSHYAQLDVKVPGASLQNAGFDGIAVKKGERYNFSLFARAEVATKLLVRLLARDGKVLSQATVSVGTGTWKNYKTVLNAAESATDAVLDIQPQTAGKLSLDMISLFPQKTFKGRNNGLRADLAQVVADIHPRFIRFPGGCVAHGDGIDNIYRWKNSIGPLEARMPQRNLWGYHQTTGLGYYEYFQYCEDIGAAPLPVIAAGVPCQNSGTGGAGQQGGVKMEDMDEYIQDVLDLIEWANGDVKTTWGKKRAEAGHPKPFNLKYIGIGNEDLISDVFEERFTMIFNAVKKKHPEIVVIGTVGPNFEGTDYEEGWELASKLNVPMVDEHYYQSPGWFINNQDYYDRYDRNKSKVYLGEYAAHLPGRPNNLETALAEALYLTTLERNGDVVTMSSYAPLLAKEGHTQWSPDLIYFNNLEVKPTTGYEVQRLFGAHAGNEYLPASINISNNQDAVKKRVAFSIVRDSKSKDVIVKLVNLLPVAVNTSVDLSSLGVVAGKAFKATLSGGPADKNLKAVETEVAASATLNESLAPYSFTVLRFKGK